MPRALPPLALTLAATIMLAGCAPASDPVDDGVIRIVASTSVYADIAQTVVGDSAEVTAIISDTAQDPHEYEATARDALAVSRADIVIVNGGGYDTFLTTLLDSQNSTAIVIDAVQLSGLDPNAEIHDHGDDSGEHGDEHTDGEHTDGEHADDAHDHDDDGHTHGVMNEHVWYHLGTMGVLADEIVEALEQRGADTTQARSGAREIASGVQELLLRAGDLATQHRGAAVAVTEPVPLYLLESVGLHDTTPEGFSAAIEEGNDVPALLLQTMIERVESGEVAFLALNAQTTNAQTDRVWEAALAAGTPVLSFSELLPEGLSYLQWMSANLDLIESALEGA